MSKIQDKLTASLTVRELIEELQSYPEDMPVVMGVDYGDRGHTLQALTIDEVEEAEGFQLYETAYSNSGVGINHPEDLDCADEGWVESSLEEGDDEGFSVLVLR